MVKDNTKIAIFGTAGFPVNFFADKQGGGKNRDNIFAWLRARNLDALELQCTYGIRMKEEQAIRYKQLSKENNIYLTIHAPYYICLASDKQEVVERSKLEMKKAFALAEILGVSRIIFHPGGGFGKGETARKKGLERLIKALNSIKNEINTKEVKIYPEIGGKINQIGSLDEIIEICKHVEYARPCIDLAHLHARENGSMKSKEAILKVLDKIESELGRKMLEETHFHMYPVEYGIGGEKEHKAFGDRKEQSQLSLFEQDDKYYPRAEHYIDAIKEKNLKPVTICEAHNTQDIGAMLMKSLFTE